MPNYFIGAKKWIQNRLPGEHHALANVNGEKVLSVWRNGWGGAITEARWFNVQERKSAIERLRAVPPEGVVTHAGTCSQCGVDFESRHPNRLFCSDECRSASYRSIETTAPPQPACPACTGSHKTEAAAQRCRVGEQKRLREATQIMADRLELDAAVKDAFEGFRSSGGKRAGKAPKAA